MIKKMKKIFNRKGVTLIEMIFSVFVLAMILVAITNVFAPMLQTYARANNLAEANTLLDNISLLVMEDVTKATSIIPGPADPENVIPYDTLFKVQTSYFIEYYTNIDGILCRRDTRTDGFSGPLLPPDFYKNKTIAAECAVDGEGVVTLKLTLYAFDGWELVREYVARPVGLMV